MIFFFSATGNSKQVAQKLSLATNDTVVNIVECLNNKKTTFDLNANERIGFVTPTYFWGLPSPVVDFVKQLQLVGYDHQYTYMVATFGSFCGGTHNHLMRLLKPKKISLKGIFSVKMVDVWTPIFDLTNQEKNKQKTVAAQQQIATICHLVQNNTEGNYMKWPLPDFLCRIAYLFYGLSRKTDNFRVLGSCTGCGLCERQCPLGAISLKEGKPTWTKDKCAICLGCLHHCPQFAIQYGHFTERHGQYVNKGQD